MLIKVWGAWINPDAIEYLKNDYEDNSTLVITRHSYVKIPHKTTDEVAEEINKQLKG